VVVVQPVRNRVSTAHVRPKADYRVVEYRREGLPGPTQDVGRPGYTLRERE